MLTRLEWIVLKTFGKTVLDVGASTGLVHTAIKKAALETVGIDIIKAPGIIKANAETFVYKPKHYFDVVLLGDCLEHIYNPGLVLDRCKDNLKPGGQAVITTPNLRHLPVCFKDRVSGYHFHGYTPNLLAQSLREHGFNPGPPAFFKLEGAASPGGKLHNFFLKARPMFSLHFGMVGVSE